MSIIGINGKIGSGKDTVGKIIQHLTTDWADEEFQDTDMLEVRSDWKIKKFAGKLKEIASLLTRVRMEYFEDQEFKKLNMDPEWGMTYRDFLQKLGTDAMREGLHENVWVNALMSDYTKPCIASLNHAAIEKVIKDNKLNYPNWVITDMRFPNELEAVKAKQGITIHVTRSNEPIKHVDGRPLHASETALDKHTFDYYIVNDGTIEELIQKVKQILKEEGIL